MRAKRAIVGKLFASEASNRGEIFVREPHNCGETFCERSEQSWGKSVRPKRSIIGKECKILREFFLLDHNQMWCKLIIIMVAWGGPRVGAKEHVFCAHCAHTVMGKKLNRERTS